MKTKAFGLLASATVAALTPGQAQAAYTLILEQTGPGMIVATGAGSFDTTGLTFAAQGFTDQVMDASLGYVVAGARQQVTFWNGLTGPTSFGTGLFGASSSATPTGAQVGLIGFLGQIVLPYGYVSGSDLGTTTSTFVHAASNPLGLSDGIFTYSNGRPGADTFTIVVKTLPAVPEPATWALMIAGFGMTGIALRRRRTVLA